MIMNRIMKNICFTFLLLTAAHLTAQSFKTHAVKRGETLTSIAEEYGISVASILEYNKELEGPESRLRQNTILVIPLDAKREAVEEKKSNLDAPVMQAEDKERQPIGFSTHRVGRKETLYGIAQRYHVSEDEIKRYNKELYSKQLKRKMVLKIPKYKTVSQSAEKKVVPEDSGHFEVYIVKAKETRYSIANKFGITIDQLLKLNPSLSANSNELQIGQELKLPKRPGGNLAESEIQLYQSYTVPPKMTLYSLQKKFGMSTEQIKQLNPQIDERGGLKEGMVLRIPQKVQNPSAVTTANYIFYEVKPKETEYSLTRKLGLSYKDLLDLNPELQEGLKAGMVLKIPKDQTGTLEVRNALVLEKINLLDSIQPRNTPKVLFMLPFRLDKADFNDVESIEKDIEHRNDMQVSLGLYSGATIAMDSLAKLGISINAKTVDNQLHLSKTKAILANENLTSYQAIFGPLDAESVKETAIQGSRYGVPVVVPIPLTKGVGLNNVLYSYPPDSVLRNRMIGYALTKHKNQNIIVITDSRNQEAKTELQSKFPDAKIAAVTETSKNIALDLEAFVLLLSNEQENWVFLETHNFKLISSVSSILNSNINEEIKIRMFTTNKGKAFDNDVISNTHLSNLRFTYPSVYRPSPKDSFYRTYKKKYGVEPDKYAARGFDLTMDILLKLAYKPDLLQVTREVGETDYTANKFVYAKNGPGGYYNQATYIMQLEDMRVNQLKD